MTVQPHASLDAPLELLASLTAWQSVADEPAEQRSLAAWLEAWLVEELDAQVMLPVAQQPADSPPLVHVRVDIGAPDTLVLYNMYDVMPADSEGWQVDPFTGGIRRWADKGDVFISRGAENNKGPLAGMLTVVRELWQSGMLATNLEILLEGEEECGSGALRRYLARTPCPVSPALAVLFPSLCEYGGGAPRLYLGFTGMTAGRLRVAGGDWGGPQAAIHASNAAWIANPAWRLVQALAAIAPAGRNGVLETLPLDEPALRWLDELAPQFSIADELTMRKSQRLMVEGDSREALAFYLAARCSISAKSAPRRCQGAALSPRSPAPSSPCAPRPAAHPRNCWTPCARSSGCRRSQAWSLLLTTAIRAAGFPKKTPACWSC